MGLFAGGRPDVLMGEFTIAMGTGVLVNGGMKEELPLPEVRLRLAILLPSPEQRGPKGGAMNLLGRVA